MLPISKLHRLRSRPIWPVCHRSAAPMAARWADQLNFAARASPSGARAETAAPAGARPGLARQKAPRAAASAAAARTASPAPVDLTSASTKQPSASSQGEAAVRPGRNPHSSSAAQNTPSRPSTLARAK